MTQITQHISRTKKMKQVTYDENEADEADNATDNETDNTTVEYDEEGYDEESYNEESYDEDTEE